MNVAERRLAYEERRTQFLAKREHLRKLRLGLYPYLVQIYSHEFMVSQETSVAERTRRYKERHG